MTAGPTTNDPLFEATREAIEAMFERTIEAQEQGWQYVDELQKQTRRVNAALVVNARVMAEALLDLTQAWNRLLLTAATVPFSFGIPTRRFEVVGKEHVEPTEQPRAA